MLAISGPCAVNNPPEYLLQAIRRPVVRFSGTGAAMPCHQSKRYSGGMRSAHGVQRATVGSFGALVFDCFQASSRMHQSTVHHALYLVVGGLASIWWWTGSVHGHVTSGHQVHGQAGHATMATALPGGYAVGTAPMVTQVCAI